MGTRLYIEFDGNGYFKERRLCPRGYCKVAHCIMHCKRPELKEAYARRYYMMSPLLQLENDLDNQVHDLIEGKTKVRCPILARNAERRKDERDKEWKKRRRSIRSRSSVRASQRKRSKRMKQQRRR